MPAHVTDSEDDLPKGFFLEPVPNDRAIAWLEDKPPVSMEVYKKMLPALRARAIAITGIEAANVLRDARAAIAALPGGADWTQQRKQIAALLSSHIGDPDDPAKSASRVNARAELILRTHGFQAYAVAQHETMREQQDIFPWWQYLTMGDEMVRATHQALNKLIFPAESSFWQFHSPPHDWGCRCRKVSMLPEEVAERREAERHLPPESKTVIEGEALRYLEKNNKLDRGPNKVFDVTTGAERGDPGAFHFEPDSLRLSPEQLKGRYDAQTWDDFEASSKKTEVGPGVSLWQWLGGKAVKSIVKPPAPAPAPPANAPRTTAEIGAKMQATADALAKAKAEREAIYQDYLAALSDAARAGELDTLVKTFTAAVAVETALREEARDHVSIPAGERGTVTVGKTGPSVKAVVAAGAELTARYTHADLLPTVAVKTLPKEGRAYHQAGTIHVNSGTSASVVMHEITHATEQQNADVLKAAADFLKARAGTESLQTMRKLTGNKGYRADEYAYEDEFAKRGGSHYCGKYYGPRATEILTMGVERLHRDPLEFFANDRDYFDLVVTTLQKL